MPISYRKYLVTVGLLICASLLAFYINNSIKNVSTKINLGVFPIDLGEWKGKDIELEDKVYQILGTKDVLTREYKDREGDSIFLAIVYSETNRTSFHPPEICYVGGGAEVVNKRIEKIVLNNGEFLFTNKLELTSPQGLISSWYWFVLGDKFFSQYFVQQLYFLYHLLRKESPKGALVRVSTR
ncbi:MAG: EpsI family protein, partial [Candidatus Omnitrophica bacterium]|nr:EpsI family protein [Candidatus Omnitrophota bacterium]